MSQSSVSVASSESLAEFPNFHLIDHPLVADKLSRMRDKNTNTGDFRRLLKEIGVLMGYEVTRDLPQEIRSIETPLCPMEALFIRGPMVSIVPILRAGTGLADGLLELMPSARLGNIGLYRHPETHRPVEYLVKLPPAADGPFFLVDPMLATGHSAAYAIDILLRHGVKRDKIAFVALVASPEGMRVFNEEYSDIQVYAASLDSHLNEKDYIVPGLGDAGDRLYGTK